MALSSPKWSQTLTASDLTPVVGQILEAAAVHILDWEIQALKGGAAEHTGRGMGIYRVKGRAGYDAGEASWSAVVKVMRPSESAINNDPTTPDYWKRELLAYQSGILQQLPGNLVAPHCYAIQELPDGECRIWLEDIHEVDRSWTIDQHQLSARHLGQFNGAYLVGHPLPENVSWMLQGRMQQSVENDPPNKEKLLQFSETDLGGRWLTRQSVDRMMRLWEKRQPLLAALERLPTCFCHHDAYRRNLMLRKAEDGTTETVAIDWSYAGTGKVGQELGITMGVDLFFMEADARNAKAFDDAIFAGYSAGLRDAGWQGDLQLARFGYTVTAALFQGVIFTAIVAQALQAPDGIAIGEAIVGRPIDEIVEQFGEMQPFLLDLGDEALALMESLSLLN